MLSRRKFLQTSSLVSLSPVLPYLLGNTARAAGAAPDARALVVIQLDGGNDGLNTVVPYADDGYGQNRDKLRLELDELHKLDDHIALHPSMKAAKELFDDGRLCIVQGVGYPNPDRSHFRSMRIWQTAQFDDDRHDSYGWLGAALDRSTKTGAAANAIYVGEQQTPVSLWSRRSTATALATADDLKLSLAMHAVAPPPEPGEVSPTLSQFVARQVLSAYAAADDFARQQSGLPATGQSDYPNSMLASHLKLVAQLLKSGAETRVYYTIQSGYDTHSLQLNSHYRLLREFAGALKAFLDDLKSAGLGDRVVVLAFSEFGRRVKENDSQGTDHGTAGPVFLAGSQVKGGLMGNAPDLVNLDDGDLRMQFDFRQVYAAILDDWLDVPAKDVLGASFEKLPMLSS